MPRDYWRRLSLNFRKGGKVDAPRVRSYLQFRHRLAMEQAYPASATSTSEKAASPAVSM